jgi:LysW-gamma-L-lysine carboxypeptidase
VQSVNALRVEDVLRTLYDVVSIPSPSGSEGRVVKTLIDIAETMGLDAWVDRAINFYAAPRNAPSQPIILLASHVDTVRDWFPASLEDGAVRGRGAVDAKGPLVSMLYAVSVLARIDDSLPVWVAGFVGEEADSPGAKYFLETGPRSIRHVVIGEPTGTTGVAIGYRGSARIAVECSGRGGHSASPWMGESALLKAVKIVEELAARRPSVAEVTFTPTRLVAGEGDNVVPMKAELILDTRIPPGKDLGNALEELQRILPMGCEARVVGEYVPPVKVSLNKPVPRALVRAILRIGEKPRPVVKAGTSDMNYLVRMTDSIAAYGPGDPSLAHTRLEKITGEELLKAIQVYVEAVLELLGERTH